MRKLVLMEIIHQIQRVDHPLAGDPGRKVPIQTKLEIRAWIEGPRLLVQQPALPVRVLFADLLHLRTPTPPGTMKIPYDFDFRDLAQRAAIDNLLGLARV